MTRQEKGTCPYHTFGLIYLSSATTWCLLGILVQHPLQVEVTLI